MSAQVLPFQNPAAGPQPVAPCVGEWVGTIDGQPLVRYAGSGPDPVPAAILAHVVAPGLPAPALPCPVLLHVEGSDAPRPIVTGLVRQRLPTERTLVLDLERIVLQGHCEVQLRCGEASVTMRADGRVVIKGTELVSRASATHKIRGATVQIN